MSTSVAASDQATTANPASADDLEKASLDTVYENKECDRMKKYRNLKVLARFRPMTTDDLDSELINLVGKEAVFHYHKFIEDDDTPYSDQWVLTAEDQQFGDSWFPECDLEILQKKHAT